MHRQVWSTSGEIANPRLWAGQAQSAADGTVTLYPTHNGQASGTTLFGTIHAIIGIARNDTGVATAVPSIGVKTVASDRRTITMNVVTGTVLGVLGATTLFAPSGTTVDVLVVGTAF